MSKEVKSYTQVFPRIEDWPIFLLSQQRKEFVQEINEYTQQRLIEKFGKEVPDVIAKTMHMERIRIKEEPWEVDPSNEKQFWKKIRNRLLKISQGDRPQEEIDRENAEILRVVVHRYSEEIVGKFKIKTFKFARKFLTLFFNSLLYSNVSLKSYKVKAGQRRLLNRLMVKGYIDEIRNLMKKGIVVVVPTHFSNLDSILIGYALDLIGLPSFSYGAGLNLYNSDIVARYMNRIGTYRVDRRKKNPIYLETLKAMSKLSIERGTNSLFFPGGTRSRSGALESKFKLGLLGSTIEAQRSIFEKGREDKIFIVPLILSYHFVLEAQFLIEQYLIRTGREKYLRTKDNYFSPRKIMKFLWKVLFQGNEILLSIGRPMDVVGNPVDMDGNSLDQFGKTVDIKDYFTLNGAVTGDHQRERVYTKMLGDGIMKSYKKYNIVLSSHLMAFAAFNFLKQQYPKLDLFGILRLPSSDFIFPMEGLKDVVGQLRTMLIEMEQNEEIKLSEQIHWELEDLIADGIKRLGNFHVNKPLKFNKEKQLVSQNFKLLYYYHNRLDNYGLDKKIQWKVYELDVV